jgi:hypothetical protein
MIQSKEPDQNPGSTKLVLDTGIDAVLSEKETPGQGAEVVLLTRNIKIEGEAGGDQCGYEHTKQMEYRGTMSTTTNGLTCQAWTAQTPHAHGYTPENYPDAGLADGNYCRNPNGFERTWCFPDDGSRWQYCDVPMCLGGYLQVLHTPGVPQVIEGVEFTNMGQQKHRHNTAGGVPQGGSNRYPVQFLYTGDVPGSSIARNSIRNSQHRCISMDGVSNVTIASNVAHDTSGHCYYIGYEATDNVVVNNIGSRTNDLMWWGEQVSGTNDHDQATFFFRSMENDIIHNVAAGSAGRGFEMDMDWRTRGEDNAHNANLIGPGGSMRRKPMRIFRYNTAHSNWWQGYRLHHFEQYWNWGATPLFENTSAYRNREHGIYTYSELRKADVCLSSFLVPRYLDILSHHHHSLLLLFLDVVAPTWRGGFFSDNQWGLVIREQDDVNVEDIEIIGSSEIFKEHTVARDLKLCHYNGWHHEGIHMMTAIWRLGHNDPGRGLRLKNVTFSGYDKDYEGYFCKSTQVRHCCFHVYSLKPL